MTTRMRTSLDEYFALDQAKPYSELIDGEVTQKPMVGKRHSRMIPRANALPSGVRARRLGISPPPPF